MAAKVEWSYNPPVLLYYITNRQQLGDTPIQQRKHLLSRIESGARAGIDCIELCEEDLSARELELLAGDALKVVREHNSTAKFLIHSRTDVALATGADGVCLASKDISPADARAVAHSPSFLIAQSCHSIEDVRMAESQGADLALLSPILEKPGTHIAPLGIATLTAIAADYARPDNRVEAGNNRHHICLLAHGGVTAKNAGACIQAGAIGIAETWLFQNGDIGETAKQLRKL